MSCITRCVLRWGLISGLALGGMTLLIGPDRVAAGLAQLRSKAQNVVDHVVDDPVAIRRQLEKLADDYPDRIAEVQGEIAAVTRQIELLDRDVQIASRVVASTTEDLGVLKNKITRAEEAMEEASEERGQYASNPPARVVIRFDGLRFSVDEAYREAIRIGTIRETFQDRLAFEREQLVMLKEQKARLTEILDKLETDFNTYQAQLWTLDRQIDAIERNDRLIALMEEQQETLAGYDRYERVGNLSQIHAKLAELKAVQNAQIETLQKKAHRDDYEQRARMELQSDEVETESLFEDVFEDEQAPADGEPAKSTKRSVAWAAPIVID